MRALEEEQNRTRAAVWADNISHRFYSAQLDGIREDTLVRVNKRDIDPVHLDGLVEWQREQILVPNSKLELDEVNRCLRRVNRPTRPGRRKVLVMVG